MCHYVVAEVRSENANAMRGVKMMPQKRMRKEGEEANEKHEKKWGAMVC